MRKKNHKFTKKHKKSHRFARKKPKKFSEIKVTKCFCQGPTLLHLILQTAPLTMFYACCGWRNQIILMIMLMILVQNRQIIINIRTLTN